MVAPLELPVALPAYQRGDFIGDQLQVIEKLGEGGFGIVYLARSLASDDILAVKTLRAELLRDAKTRAMFEKEARIWIDLGAHPNLVRASWISEIGGRLYIGMEYVKAGAGRPTTSKDTSRRDPSKPARRSCGPSSSAAAWSTRCRRAFVAIATSSPRTS
jgi:serine/threonine protein kinase